MADLRYKAYGVSVLIFAMDRLTKWIVEQRVSFFDTHKVIPGFFDIVRSENRGVAFGIFNDSTSEWRTRLLILAALAAVVMVSAMLWNARKLDRYSVWGLSLILGGAAGNLFDRIMYGRVTDFLLLYVGSFQWPTFNVADCGVFIGSGLLLIDVVRPKKQAANVS
jgi:signal peptidase II